MRFGAKKLTLAAVVAGTALTLGVILLPGVDFAYRNPGLHVAIDTFDGSIALLVAFLLYGRFARSGAVADLLLVSALLLLGLSNWFLSAIPITLTGTKIEGLTTWGTLMTQVLGGVTLVGATFSGTRKLHLSRRGALLLLPSVAVVLLVGITVTLLDLPPAVEASDPANPTDPRLSNHGLVATLHFGLMLVSALTALRFSSLAESDHDDLMRWFGAGAALASFARINYLFYPSLYSDYVYIGDVFRMGFYMMLLIGAGREITSYWRGLAETAATEERRRIARDLHDGLAQELAFMWSDIQTLRRAYPKDEKVIRASGSAERALDESRRAIGSFTRSPNEPLDVAISSFIEETARRLDARVRLDLEPGIEVNTKLREDLLRVIREAVTNAARHGRAEMITVRLSREGGLRLEIRDDGEGFDPDQPLRAGGFGIISMRERVVAHGGQLQITSQPGLGTSVKVELP